MSFFKNVVAVLGFQEDVIEHNIATSRVPILVGVSEGFLDLVVNVTFYTTSGTAEGIDRINTLAFNHLLHCSWRRF